jgi:hypothetical protein
VRLPAWLQARLGPVRRDHQGVGSVDVTLTMDTERFQTALRSLGKSAGVAAVGMAGFGQAVKAAMEAEKDLARVAAIRRHSPRERTAGDDLREGLDRMILGLYEPPLWDAKETAHPANQMFANRQAMKRRELEAMRLRGVIRWQVRGGLAFVREPTVADRDAVVQGLLRDTYRGIHREQRIAFAIAYMRGWADTEDMDAGPCRSCQGSGLYPNPTGVFYAPTEWLGCPDCQGTGNFDQRAA